MTSTIVAAASPQGAAERAVIRMSGPRARAIVGEVCGGVVRLGSGEPLCVRGSEHEGPSGAGPRGDGSAPESRGAFRALFDDGEGQVPCLLLWMPGPRSFTAEDVAEFHLPGHPGLLRLALARLQQLGAEMAGPGEFTRRAFENGRIDLTQAEGVLALIEARSRAEQRAATALLTGGLEGRIRGVREHLEAVRALTEASLDFDEADTGHVPVAELQRLGALALERVEEALGWERQRGMGAVAAPTVVLAGEANAGKSTLFNRLGGGRLHAAGGDALVSPMPGTTRAAKRVEWDLGGSVPCILVDSAGRDAASDSGNGADAGPGAADPDRLSEAQSLQLAAQADLVLWTVDAAAPSPRGPWPELEGHRVLLLWNQQDRADASSEPPTSLRAGVADWLPVSGATGVGLAALEERVARFLGLWGPSYRSKGASGHADDPRAGAGAGTGTGTGAPEPEGGPGAGVELAARHVAALELARTALESGLSAMGAGMPLDLIAEELKGATDALDAIVGHTATEDLLTRIFAQFCLGK